MSLNAVLCLIPFYSLLLLFRFSSFFPFFFRCLPPLSTPLSLFTSLPLPSNLQSGGAEVEQSIFEAYLSFLSSFFSVPYYSFTFTFISSPFTSIYYLPTTICLFSSIFLSQFPFPFPISHLPSSIFHIPSPISHLPYPISHLPSPISHSFPTHWQPCILPSRHNSADNTKFTVPLTRHDTGPRLDLIILIPSSFILNPISPPLLPIISSRISPQPSR